MKAFKNKVVSSIEAMRLPSKKRSHPTLHNELQPCKDLYYVKLDSGRARELTAMETPSIPWLKSEPNNRLIRQLSDFLKEYGKVNELEKPKKGSHVVWIKEHLGFGFNTLQIYSSPYNGISYIHCNLLDIQNVNHGAQMNVSFIAHHPLEIVSRLNDFKMLNWCPKDSTCHVQCAECPEL